MVYIALLRGINVGGAKTVKMAELVTICESLGFQKISTYLQSGNVVFEAETLATDIIQDKIEAAILQKFQFEVKVIVRTVAELAALISGNPFREDPQIETDKLHITFLRDHPKGKDGPENEMNKEANEAFVMGDRAVYLYCPNGYGRTKLTNQAFERSLKTVATTRNWKSAGAILEIALEKQKN